MFQRRISHVNRLNVDTLIFSSTIQLGDTKFIDSTNYTFALQREQELFYGNEGTFNDPVFTEDILFAPLDESFALNTTHTSPFIHIDFIDIGGVTASSIIHIGSTQDVRMQAKIKNIRHLFAERERRRQPR
ncbi:spore germination protein GerPE [Peribacillus deserti]|uniref:Spore germination protein GerPE n=1 Tax=Peribacillus deserti TaxID=673318 RepID=A0A2N5M7U4_9BACI|nr:spore germination protein GerPE [Peribacillus deserti]PLT30426.1 spore germination protein GerPE [Peribacillus deserti]